MIYNNFLGPYPPPVKCLLDKPLHFALLDTKTIQEHFGRYSLIIC